MLARSWPYGIVLHIASFRKEQRYLGQLAAVELTEVELAEVAL